MESISYLKGTKFKYRIFSKFLIRFRFQKKLVIILYNVQFYKINALIPKKTLKDQMTRNSFHIGMCIYRKENIFRDKIT